MPCALRLGVTLPTFSSDAAEAIVAARIAEEAGVDGVFVFDHLWPMGAPGRPALWAFAVLGAVAAATARVCIGPLVARIGVLPDDDLIRVFRTLAAVGERGRLIAAIGVGDRLSAEENVAYGIEYPPAAERLDAAVQVLNDLRALGVETWMGARSVSSVAIARASADALNLWGVSAAEVRKGSSAGGRLTWGGQVLVGRDDADTRRLIDRYGRRPGVPTGTVSEVADHLGALGDAGADWCVVAPLDYLGEPRRSMETVGLVAEAVR